MNDLRPLQFIRQGYERFLEAQQLRMSSNVDGLALLAVLGLLCGLLAGAVIIALRLTMELVADQYMPGGNVEGFENLSPRARFLLCVVGGLVIGLILRALKPKSTSMGVVHVIERLEYHQGHLPFKNAVLQFIIAALALLSGHSVGREGPSVHLGAASGSILARILRVPNNGVRILVASGVAAAIGAAFNTPLAGVIFAMEVVLMDYTVIGFTPVIIAAVSATSLTRIVFGDATAFAIPAFELTAVSEIPVIALMGVMIGCLSALFIQMTLFTTSLFMHQSIWLRTTLAGVITGSIAMYLPEVMGTGYDTVNHIFLAQFGLVAVLLLTLAKIVATASAIGLGIPAGLIGPTLFMGAAGGAAFGWATSLWMPDIASPGFYAILGMAAMMGATLQAPLAALIALLELTGTQAVILPGMIAVVMAALITRALFGKSSIYRHLMLVRGLDFRNSPMSKALRRIGVAKVMERNFVESSAVVSRAAAESLLQREPRWILLRSADRKRTASILPASDLASFLYQEADPDNPTVQPLEDEDDLDLSRIPALRQEASAVSIVATLYEADEKMRARDCQLLFVTGAHGAARHKIYGVVTREHIDNSYRL
ncbi:MAG: chloride channel protein [Gammaproteobacteria bacterium]|nr:chloride channel protein [Gammaproteobacteria bacterium]